MAATPTSDSDAKEIRPAVAKKLFPMKDSSGGLGGFTESHAPVPVSVPWGPHMGGNGGMTVANGTPSVVYGQDPPGGRDSSGAAHGSQPAPGVPTGKGNG